MTASIAGPEREAGTEETEFNTDPEPTLESGNVRAQSEQHSTREPLPWIGALPNPRVGPMVVLNDAGYLVPLFTVGDLLRGCRYFWRS